MEKQLQIPFQLEGNTANRDTIRSVSTPVSQMYKVALSQIKIRPGFNARVQPPGVPDELWEKILGIPDLADGIFVSNGPADPLIGDFYKVDEYFYLTDGERRFRALRHLMATDRDTYPNNKPVDAVFVLLNPDKTTDLERKAKIGTTQGKLPLTQMQWGHYYLSIKTDYKLTHQQIADLFKCSRGKIDNYILATTLPQDVQDDIDAGKKNITTEVTALRRAKADTDDEKHEKTPSEAAHDRKKDEESKMSGDEDDFEEKDNSVKGVSSMGGPKEDTSSGAITLGKDSIYQNQEDDARWKQFIHRYTVLQEDCAKAADADQEVFITKMIERLKMEYSLRVK